jgi:MFS family permease
MVKQTLMISQAYVSDLSHPDRRSVWIGRAQAIAAFGYFLGPTVGGFLSKLSMSFPAFAASSLFIVDIILVWFLLPESLDMESPSVTSKDKKGEKDAPSSKSFEWKALLQRDTLVLFTMQAVFFFSLETLQSVIPYYVKVRFSLEPQQNGMMMSIAGMMMVFVKAFLANRVIRRWGEKNVMFGAAIVGAGAYVAATQCPSIHVFFVILLLLTSSNGIITIALTSLFTKSFPRDIIGRMLGVSGSMRGVMGVVAPSVGFYMINVAGPCSPMFVSSTLSIIFVVFIGFFLAKGQKTKEP